MISTSHFAQIVDNRFEEPEQESSAFKANVHNESAVQEPAQSSANGGNPGDPVPIDNFIPLLAITAVAIIIYITRKKNNLLSNK